MLDLSRRLFSTAPARWFLIFLAALSVFLLLARVPSLAASSSATYRSAQSVEVCKKDQRGNLAYLCGLAREVRGTMMPRISPLDPLRLTDPRKDAFDEPALLGLVLTLSYTFLAWTCHACHERTLRHRVIAGLGLLD